MENFWFKTFCNSKSCKTFPEIVSYMQYFAYCYNYKTEHQDYLDSQSPVQEGCKLDGCIVSAKPVS